MLLLGPLKLHRHPRCYLGHSVNCIQVCCQGAGCRLISPVKKTSAPTQIENKDTDTKMLLCFSLAKTLCLMKWQIKTKTLIQKACLAFP